MRKPIKVLVADDHAVVRAGLVMLVNAENDMTVVAQTSTAAQTVEKAKARKPDVVLLDLQMPGGGFSAARRLLAQKNPPAILAVSIHDDAMHLRTALRIGIAGYVTKRAVCDVMIAGIREVHAGRIYIDPMLSDVVAEELVGVTRNKRPVPPDLTPTMLQVLRLAAWGYTNEQIAAELSVAPKTVETRRANIMRRLQLSNRAELVQYAFSVGLMNEPPLLSNQKQ